MALDFDEANDKELLNILQTSVTCVAEVSKAIGSRDGHKDLFIALGSLITVGTIFKNPKDLLKHLKQEDKDTRYVMFSHIIYCMRAILTHIPKDCVLPKDNGLLAMLFTLSVMKIPKNSA